MESLSDGRRSSSRSAIRRMLHIRLFFLSTRVVESSGNDLDITYINQHSWWVRCSKWWGKSKRASSAWSTKTKTNKKNLVAAPTRFLPVLVNQCVLLDRPQSWSAIISLYQKAEPFEQGSPLTVWGKPNTTSQQAAVGASRPRRATSRCFQMSLRVHMRPPPSASQRKKLGGHTQMWWCLLAKEMCELGTPHPMSQTLVGGGCGGILHQKAKKQSWWGWQIKKKRRKRREGLHPIRALASSVRNVSHQSKLFLILR